MATVNDNNVVSFDVRDRKVDLVELLPQIYKPIYDFRTVANECATELEPLYNGVFKILDNQFIASCDGDTLAKWERYFNITPNGTDTIDERKFRVLAKLNDSPPYTDRYLVQRLTELCGTNGFILTRDYGNYNLLVEIALDSLANTETIKKIIGDIVPANLNVTVREYCARYTQLTQFTHDELSGYTHNDVKLGVMLE